MTVTCTRYPHLQAWAMMRAWGVDEPPDWWLGWMHRTNESVRGVFT